MFRISFRCLCFPCKRNKRRSSLDESLEENGSMNPTIYSDTVYNAFENGQHLDDDIFLATRPSSVASSRTADDIQLTGLTSARKKKPIPHYAIALQRSPRVAPTSKLPD